MVVAVVAVAVVVVVVLVAHHHHPTETTEKVWVLKEVLVVVQNVVKMRSIVCCMNLQQETFCRCPLCGKEVGSFSASPSDLRPATCFAEATVILNHWRHGIVPIQKCCSCRYTSLKHIPRMAGALEA